MKKNVKNPNKLCVAITGSFCTGKTLVLNIVKKLGYPIFSFDAEVADLIKNDKEIKNDIKQQFPDAWSNKEIAKAELAEIVFADHTKLGLLEKILAKKLYQRRDDFVRSFNQGQAKVAFFEAPLLFERKNQDKYDLVILTYAPREICRKRAVSKGVSELRYQQITSLQIAPEIKKKMSDYSIDTEHELKDIDRQVEEILAEIDG